MNWEAKCRELQKRVAELERENRDLRRWYSVQKEKSGYSPVCANEWRYGVCSKPKGKCSKCENRELVTLDDGAIYKHLSGKDANGCDVIGLYGIPYLLLGDIAEITAFILGNYFQVLVKPVNFWIIFGVFQTNNDNAALFIGAADMS